MAKEEKMLSAFSNILYIKEGLRISPTDLKSTRTINLLPEETLNIIKKYENYFNKIEEIVEFIDDVRKPYAIYNFVRKYALENGTIHKRKITTNSGEILEVEDYYEPDNPDEYVMIIIDHVGLISTEKNYDTNLPMTLHEAMGKLSSDYLVKLRNRFKYIPVVIQQQASAQESIENKKFNRLKPTLDGLAGNKELQRDANVVVGLFSPFRHEIPEYLGYNITKFKDSIRFLEVLASREGGGGTICPLYFDGAVNYFKELPLPNDAKNIEKVYEFIKNNKK